MRHNFLIAAGFLSAASVVMTTGCEERGVSFIEPDPDKSIYITLDDDSLLRVAEVRGKLRFAKTAPGYGEDSASVIGFGRTLPVSHAYTKINMFEAMAFMNGDWEKIYDKAVKHSELGNEKINPDLVRGSLGYFVVKLDEREAVYTTAPFKGTNKHIERPEETAPQHIERINTRTFLPADWDQKHKHVSLPLIIKMKDGGLLRIKERRDGNGNSPLTFEKCAAGYAKYEAEIAPFEVGAERGWPTANVYTDISADEALAYFDGDWEPIYRQALWQYTVWNSGAVNPYTVAATLKPLSTNPGGEITIASTVDATIISGPEISTSLHTKKSIESGKEGVDASIGFANFIFNTNSQKTYFWLTEEPLTSDLQFDNIEFDDIDETDFSMLSAFYDNMYDVDNIMYHFQIGNFTEDKYFSALSDVVPKLDESMAQLEALKRNKEDQSPEPHLQSSLDSPNLTPYQVSSSAPLNLTPYLD